MSENENNAETPMNEEDMIKSLYGENKKITDGGYDKSLSVKCVNGTFVGRKTDGIVAYRGIPFVGKQPVRELRWKAPVPYFLTKYYMP